MSEMCQDLAAKCLEKLMINYFTDIILYGGRTNASFTTLVSNQYEKLKKKHGRVIIVYYIPF